MVIYYEKNNELERKIKAVEHDVMTPTLPANLQVNEQVEYYNSEGLEFVSIPYELSGKIFDYIVCVTEAGEFKALKPKGGQ